MTEIAPQAESKPVDFSVEVGRVAQKIKGIRSIAQTSGMFRFDLPRLVSKPTLEFEGFDEGTSHASLEGTTLSVSRDFVFRATDQSDRAVVIDIKATFSLEYDLVEPEAIRDEVLQAAADLNSRFNLTAYWREFVHSGCARAGLPPLPIPPFNGLRALRGLKPKATTGAA